MATCARCGRSRLRNSSAAVVAGVVGIPAFLSASVSQRSPSRFLFVSPLYSSIYYSQFHNYSGVGTYSRTTSSVLSMSQKLQAPRTKHDTHLTY